MEPLGGRMVEGSYRVHIELMDRPQFDARPNQSRNIDR
jgi:hypothetical protein